MRRLVCLVGLIVLGLSGVAQAWQPPPTTDEGRLAYFLPIARAAQQQLWPASPCAGNEVIHLHADVELAELDKTDGIASLSRGGSIGWGCQIWIGSGIDDAERFCVGLVHEFGNTAGHYDNTIPGDVMNVGVGASDWPPCAAAVEPHGVAAARYFVRQYLSPGWTITCTSLRDPHPRCRATRGHRTQRFSVHIVGGEVVSVDTI